MIRAATLGAALGAVLAAGPAQTATAQVPCRLALVLAIDVSASVDMQEDRLQREGLATALLAPEVQTAFLSGNLPVALAVYEWSGRWNQEILLDWTLIGTPADLAGAASDIAASRRSYSEFPTAMGYALGFGAGLFDRGPGCLFRTLDLSGDGVNNEGFGPRLAYENFGFADVTVNGLVILGADPDEDARLQGFFSREVVHGSGAFLEVADGFDDFERAMRRKLEREVRAATVGTVVPNSGRAPG